ncbi:hypothetical protein FB45DRAFT_9554 [Roridomyces roridus]|uniref:PX domain-containing protein n=1 Tax=Roridomyces roridus TaxID=1738132 RepID=A0AAD7G0X6_9AGAR|nr:hypothetical protein FB45DRAFT_9554 [Roridomyces roridus]
MLPPVKLGGNYNFCMRVCPASRGDRVSVSSRGSHTEYEILRRWEDCLIFQDTLEREYNRLAFSKRSRLVAGKGVRKNGVYLNSDRASSWESLPPGPEPDSVAQDIHDLIPRLTKRGTMFRASQATTDQRQAELTAFITALLADDVPTLLHDFRREREVTDFFGFWRRDHDIQQKKSPSKSPSSGKSRSSVTSSVFSSYFSTAASDTAVDSPSRRERALSSASSDSSSIPSTGSARSSISVQITLDDEPVPFGHNPLHGGNLEPQQRPEQLERKPSFRGGKFLAAVARRARKNIVEDSQGPPCPDSRASNATTVNQQHPCRESWQTTASGMTFLQDLHLTLPNESNEDDTHSSRMSMASIATFRTEVSAEGVMPRYYLPESNPARLSTASFMTDMSADAIIPSASRRATLTRAPRRDSVASSVISEGDAIDEYFFDAFPRPCSFIPQVPVQTRPETPRISIPSPPSPTASEFDSPSPTTPESPISPTFLRRKQALMARSPSPSASIAASVLSDSTMQSAFSDSTGSTITPSVYSFYSARSDFSSTTAASASTTSSSGPLVIKAAHNSSIILLRAEEDLSLTAVRQKLQDKFLGQEGITLPDKFALAYMIPASPVKATMRARGNSVSSSSKDTALMEMLSTEEEWMRLRASLDGAKLTLRVVAPVA